MGDDPPVKCTSDDDCPSDKPDCIKESGDEGPSGKKCRSDDDCTSGMNTDFIKSPSEDEGVCGIWMKKIKRKKSRKSNKKSGRV